MIEAYFLTPPASLDVQEPHSYKVMGLYQLDSYTLAEWAYGDLGPNGEYATGNTLYHRHEILVCTGGCLNLGEGSDLASEATHIADASSMITFQFNTRVGAYGIPYAVAVGLRNAENYTPL